MYTKEKLNELREYFIRTIPRLKEEDNKAKKDYGKSFDFELSVKDLGEKAFDFMEKNGTFWF